MNPPEERIWKDDKANHHDLYFPDNIYKEDERYDRKHDRRRFSPKHNVPNFPRKRYSHERPDKFEFRGGYDKNQRDFKERERGGEYHDYRKDEPRDYRRDNFKDDFYHSSHQPIPQHNYKQPNYSSSFYQPHLPSQVDYMNKKRERSQSPQKKYQNNFPIICSISRTYFKYFEDHFSSIKKEVYSSIYNLDDFRFKHFKGSDECYLLIDSLNYNAVRKAFRYFCDKTYDFLRSKYFDRMSYLKLNILVPHRK